MHEFLLVGAVLGAICGALHAIHLYRRRVASDGAPRAEAVYFGVWTVALWTLFGGYLLLFWGLGAVGLALSRLRRSIGGRR